MPDRLIVFNVSISTELSDVNYHSAVNQCTK